MPIDENRYYDSANYRLEVSEKNRMKKAQEGIDKLKTSNSTSINHKTSNNISGIAGIFSYIYDCSGIIFNPIESYVLKLPRLITIPLYIISLFIAVLIASDFGKLPEGRNIIINIGIWMIAAVPFSYFAYMFIRFFIFIFIFLFSAHFLLE